MIGTLGSFSNYNNLARNNQRNKLSFGEDQQNHIPKLINTKPDKDDCSNKTGNEPHQADTKPSTPYNFKQTTLKNGTNIYLPCTEGEKNSIPYDEIVNSNKKVTLADVGGLPESVKKLLQEKLLGLSKHKEVAAQMGLKPKNMLLLTGPPGCGKTLIAKALANENDCIYMPVEKTDIVTKWINESPKLIHNKFEEARTLATKEGKPVLIFLDEFETLAPSRKGNENDGSKMSNDVTTQILTELDGKDSDNSGLIILAASNKPDIVDPAIKRSKRMETVEIPMPDEKGCLEIFNIHAKGRTISPDIEKKQLAKKMADNKFSGSDVAELLNTAAFNTLDRNGISVKMAQSNKPIMLTAEQKTIKQEDIDAAFDSILEVRKNGEKDYLSNNERKKEEIKKQLRLRRQAESELAEEYRQFAKTQTTERNSMGWPIKKQETT